MNEPSKLGPNRHDPAEFDKTPNRVGVRAPPAEARTLVDSASNVTVMYRFATRRLTRGRPPRTAIPLPSDSTPSKAMALLAVELAPYLGPLLKKELGIGEPPEDGWVDVVAELPLLKRVLQQACRTGRLLGRRVGRRWLVRRKDFNSWIASHPSGQRPPEPLPSAPPTKSPSKTLSPAEIWELGVDEMRQSLGMRRLTDEERAAKGLPPYDVEAEYQRHLDDQKKRAEEEAQRKRDDNDPEVAKARAIAVRAEDERRRGKPSKLPRARCARCGREGQKRKFDDAPIAHPCPHLYGWGCVNASGNRSYDGTSKCPWCAEERRKAGDTP